MGKTKALKWEEESFSLLPSLPCFPLITINNPLLSTLCVCVLGSPVVRPSGLGPGRKTSLRQIGLLPVFLIISRYIEVQIDRTVCFTTSFGVAVRLQPSPNLNFYSFLPLRAHKVTMYRNHQHQQKCKNLNFGPL